MVAQFEIIGNYNVMKLPNGMYRVKVNNGNIGAGLWDEAAVNKLRQKYSTTQNITNADNPYKMSYKDSKNILLWGTGEPGLHNLKAFDEALFTVLDEEVKAPKNILLTGLWGLI